jgi:ABC-type nitrate/sulfonate/bicarbonate transport system permease component
MHRSNVLPWFVLLGSLALIWEFIVRFHIVSPAVLASPTEIVAALPALLSPRRYGPDLVSTAVHAFAAFVLGSSIGVGLGTSVHRARAFRGPLSFLIDFLRSIPATALVPVFFILVGVGDRTKIAAGAFSCGLVVALATLQGLLRRPIAQVETADLLAIGGLRRLLLIDIPGASTELFIGLRAGVSLALVLVVVSEMLIGADRGLGRVIADMRYTDDKPLMYAAIIMAGCIGYSFNYALAMLERYCIHWRIEA